MANMVVLLCIAVFHPTLESVVCAAVILSDHADGAVRTIVDNTLYPWQYASKRKVGNRR